MSPKRFFESNKISYADFLKTIEVMMQHKNFFCEKSCIERGVEAISKIDEDSKKRLIQTAVKIDKDFSVAGATNRNCAHKLPIILKSADLIVNNGEKVKDLSNEELILISYFYSTYQIPTTDKKFDLFLNKELLKSVQEKTSNYHTQFDILTAIDIKLDNLNVAEMDDLQYNSVIREEISTIKNSTAEELTNMVNIDETVDKKMQELGF